MPSCWLRAITGKDTIIAVPRSASSSDRLGLGIMRGVSRLTYNTIMYIHVFNKPHGLC